MMWISVNMLHNVCTTEWPSDPKESQKIAIILLSSACLFVEDLELKGEYKDNNNESYEYVANFVAMTSVLTIHLKKKIILLKL